MARLEEYLAAYDAQLPLLVDWLGALPPDVAERPSRLAGWTIRDLAFHTTEVPRALVLAVTAARPSGKPLTIASYTARWKENAPEIEARERDGAAGLTLEAIVERHAAAATELHAAVASAGDEVVAARRGPIKVSDLLATRVNELVVHSLDLSASLPDRPAVELDRKALGVSCRMLTGILAERVPGHTVEVRVPPYAAIQCVAGPRHTRGTPPNVVEIQPQTWVELATGRLAWSGAVSDGRVRASGERSDISSLLPVLS